MAISVVAIPVISFLALRKNKAKLGDLEDANTQKRYAYLVKGYRSRYYWWEVCVVVPRKLVGSHFSLLRLLLLMLMLSPNADATNAAANAYAAAWC